MSDDPGPPQNIHPPKPRESPPPPRPAAIGSSQPIDVRDLIRHGTTSGPVLSVKTPVKMPLDAEEKKMLAVLCIGAIVGPIFLWQGLQNIITASEVRSWVTAPGIVQYVGHSGQGNHRNIRPVVNYSYEVNGLHYDGKRIDLGDHPGVESLGYYKGQHVSVLYDPKNPQSALLEAGGSMVNWFKLGLGTLLTGLGVYAVVDFISGFIRRT